MSLSDDGHEELALSRAQLRSVEDDLLGALTPDERATLYDLLVRAVGGVLSGPCAGAPMATDPCAVPDQPAC